MLNRIPSPEFSIHSIVQPSGGYLRMNALSDTLRNRSAKGRRPIRLICFTAPAKS